MWLDARASRARVNSCRGIANALRGAYKQRCADWSHRDCTTARTLCMYDVYLYLLWFTPVWSHSPRHSHLKRSSNPARRT